jgi:hypothetical protein
VSTNPRRVKVAAPASRRTPTIIETIAPGGMFEPWFRGPSWDPWRTVLRPIFGLPMDESQTAFFKSVAGDRVAPTASIREFWAIVGRRGGKDSIISLIAAYMASTFDPRGILRPGERAVVACIAPDRATALIIWRYVAAFFQEIPALRDMVQRETKDLIELKNFVDIAILTDDFKTVRGRPILCCIFDEVAMMDSGASESSIELYRAIVPGMATIRQAKLFGISTPYAKKGLLYRRYSDHFSKDSDDVLVIQAPSHTMNPVLDTRDRDRQMAEDLAVARAEWYAEFRDDLVAFVDPAKVDLCVEKGREEIQPAQGVTYYAAVDPSGGSSDSMTLAIAHADGDRGILDLVREWTSPFSPEKVVSEIIEICRRYNANTVTGDRYAGEWVREPFRLHGFEYRLADLTRSEAYLTILPAINSAKVELLDNRRMISQLCSLERRVARSGKDSVDHPRGGHDDVINAAALALVGAALAPKSSADNWIEYLRRECVRAGVDRDDISAPDPSWGFSFGGKIERYDR